MTGKQFSVGLERSQRMKSSNPSSRGNSKIVNNCNQSSLCFAWTLRKMAQSPVMTDFIQWSWSILMKGDASETETNTMQQQQQKHLGQHQSPNRPKKEIAFNGSRQDLAPEATPAHGTIQVPERATAKERKEKAKAKAKAKEKEKAKAKARAKAKANMHSQKPEHKHQDQHLEASHLQAKKIGRYADFS